MIAEITPVENMVIRIKKALPPLQGAFLFFLRFSPKSIFCPRNLLFTGVILRQQRTNHTKCKTL